MQIRSRLLEFRSGISGLCYFILHISQRIFIHWSGLTSIQNLTKWHMVLICVNKKEHLAGHHFHSSEDVFEASGTVKNDALFLTFSSVQTVWKSTDCGVITFRLHTTNNISVLISLLNCCIVSVYTVLQSYYMKMWCAINNVQISKLLNVLTSQSQISYACLSVQSI